MTELSIKEVQTKETPKLSVGQLVAKMLQGPGQVEVLPAPEELCQHKQDTELKLASNMGKQYTCGSLSTHGETGYHLKFLNQEEVAQTKSYGYFEEVPYFQFTAQALQHYLSSSNSFSRQIATWWIAAYFPRFYWEAKAIAFGKTIETEGKLEVKGVEI